MVTVCKHCGGRNLTPYRQINGNGATVIILRCDNCGRNPDAAQPFQRKSDYPNFDTFPILQNYIINKEPCAVLGCENTDTEYHHFAPRYLFGADAERYPREYLCRMHHKEWHDKVTPEMHKRR
jgi:hypothetical protein